MKTILVILTMLVALSSTSQTNFKWDIIDSVNKTKGQIYTDTKLFIAQTWNSAQDVIQNDDKESGSILIKGNTKIVQNVPVGLQYIYYYNYTITFLMKDGKVKIMLDNVKCTSVTPPTNARYSLKCIQPFEGEDYPGTVWEYNLAKKQQKELMINLKNDLQNIVDNYLKTIKIQSVISKEW